MRKNLRGAGEGEGGKDILWCQTQRTVLYVVIGLLSECVSVEFIFTGLLAGKVNKLCTYGIVMYFQFSL